jgi:hypothetical protein
MPVETGIQVYLKSPDYWCRYDCLSCEWIEQILAILKSQFTFQFELLRNSFRQILL